VTFAAIALFILLFVATAVFLTLKIAGVLD
jgi:hypothetical protein